MAESTSSRKEFALDFERLGLFVVIPVGCWAYYTTFRGLVDIMRRSPDDYAGVVGALIGAAAILLMMAMTSWLLGGELAATLAHRRRPDSSSRNNLVVVSIAFCFFFGMSAFFSYTYYHANFFALSSKKLTAERQPKELATQILPGLKSEVDAASTAQLEAVFSSNPLKPWTDGLAQLRRLAGSSDGRIANALATNAEQQRLHSDAVADASTQTTALKADVGEKLADMKALEADLATMQGKLAPLLEDERKNRVLANGHAAGVFSPGAECGPKCRPFRDKADSDLHLAGGLKRLVAADQARRDIDQKAVNDDQAKIAKLNQIVTATNASGGQDLARLLTNFDSAAAAFQANPGTRTQNAFAAACSPLAGLVSQAGMAGGVLDGFACGNAAAARAAGSLDATIAGRNAFVAACLLDDPRSEVVAISDAVRGRRIDPVDALSRARNFVDRCTAMAGNAGVSTTTLGKYYGLTDVFVQNSSIDRNRFEMATNALAAFDPDARKALAVALAQDLLILLYKFVSDNYRYRAKRVFRVVRFRPIDLADREGDSIDVSVRKAFIRLARASKGDTSRILSADIKSAQLRPDVAVNLDGLLRTLMRNEFVWEDGGGVFSIDNSVVRRFEAELSGEVIEPQDSPPVLSKVQEDRLRPGERFAAEGEDVSPSGTDTASAEVIRPVKERRRRRSLMDYEFSGGRRAESKGTAPPPHAARPSATTPETAPEPPASAPPSLTETAQSPEEGSAFDFLRTKRTPPPS